MIGRPEAGEVEAGCDILALAAAADVRVEGSRMRQPG